MYFGPNDLWGFLNHENALIWKTDSSQIKWIISGAFFQYLSNILSLLILLTFLNSSAKSQIPTFSKIMFHSDKTVCMQENCLIPVPVPSEVGLSEVLLCSCSQSLLTKKRTFKSFLRQGNFYTFVNFLLYQRSWFEVLGNCKFRNQYAIQLKLFNVRFNFCKCENIIVFVFSNL